MAYAVRGLCSQGCDCTVSYILTYMEGLELTVATISAVPFIDAFLGDLLVFSCGGLVASCLVDGGVDVSADGFASAVDHTDALTD